MTDIKHLPGVEEKLKSRFRLTFLPDANRQSLMQVIEGYDAIFTNPNKSRVFISRELLVQARRLKCIATASTGTSHIDLNATRDLNIRVLSLKDERDLLAQLPSTAELAVLMTIALHRKFVSAAASTARGDWNYLPFLGGQIRGRNVGVVGMGRLGSMYAAVMHALGARVLFFDPNPSLEVANSIRVGSLRELFEACDTVSLHAHYSPEVGQIVTKEVLAHARTDLKLINTARGELIDEDALVNFLRSNPRSGYAADVLAAEQEKLGDNAILNFSQASEQVIITPHIGGMTIEGQTKAFNYAADMLVKSFAN